MYAYTARVNSDGDFADRSPTLNARFPLLSARVWNQLPAELKPSQLCRSTLTVQAQRALSQEFLSRGFESQAYHIFFTATRPAMVKAWGERGETPFLGPKNCYRAFPGPTQLLMIRAG